RLAAVVQNGRGEELREEEMAVGGPAKGVDEIAESLSATRVFLPFQESAALAASVLDPDVIMFERVVNFCFHSAIDGIGDASVRRVSEGGDVLVDGLERFVENITAFAYAPDG